MKLNTDYYSGNHCPCCGRNINDIWNHVIHQPRDQFNRQEWKGHVRHGDNDYFYDSNSINNCPMCGHEYQDGDTTCRSEGIGEFGGQIAYQEFPVSSHCRECGHDEGWE